MCVYISVWDIFIISYYIFRGSKMSLKYFICFYLRWCIVMTWVLTGSGRLLWQGTSDPVVRCPPENSDVLKTVYCPSWQCAWGHNIASGSSCLLCDTRHACKPVMLSDICHTTLHMHRRSWHISPSPWKTLVKDGIYCNTQAGIPRFCSESFSINSCLKFIKLCTFDIRCSKHLCSLNLYQLTAD